jgi:two-component system osmolarity sensor histidine kinase EnvZ
MHGERSSRSLFRSTATTVALALFLFQFVVISATVNYVMLPMAKRSADDLSALLVLSAQTWVELPPETRKDFELELISKHQFMVFEDLPPLPAREGFRPYLNLLDGALSERTGGQVSVKVTELETTWFWAEIPAGGKLIRIGFPKERLDMDPPMLLMLALVAMVVLTVVTALILARRITEPLSQLSLAAKRVGEGELPESLPHTNIKELSGLTTTFKQMAFQVRELLAGRTVMLAGISHDLRTPLARMRLAIEMLPQDTDPKQIARLQHDIEYMDKLIGEFLALSRDMQKETAEQIDITGLLQELAEDMREQGVQIVWQATGHVMRAVGPVSLRRVLSNLLGNARRYGAGSPIEMELEANETSTVVRILDRGPGIPAAESESVFRPFYRLESSRSHATGGTGLGLAIVRQLCEANGWIVELLPRVGGGTEARLKIPR